MVYFKRAEFWHLVVIAIGSPTVERVFAEYCRQEDVGVPVINCWLEGYGIGGPCDPGCARSERVLALRLRGPRPVPKLGPFEIGHKSAA